MEATRIHAPSDRANEVDAFRVTTRDDAWRMPSSVDPEGTVTTKCDGSEVPPNMVIDFAGSLTESVIGGYRLLEEVQRGQVHSIYRGASLETGEIVAIKVLRRRSRGSASKRFQLEWDFIRTMSHPHVINALEYVSNGELSCLVLEYLPGPNLEMLVDAEGPLDYVRAASYLYQAARGMAHAHSRGIIHRDLKPSNLCLTSDGTIKVIDFGVSLDSNAASSLTCEHGDQLVGTVNYMAPEQSLAVHEVSEQADIYSLGATLYFLLCGCPPSPQGTLAERLWMHRFEQPAEIHSFRPDAPEELVDLCERMMAKDPAERIASMGEVAVLLRSWLVGV